MSPSPVNIDYASEGDREGVLLGIKGLVLPVSPFAYEGEENYLFTGDLFYNPANHLLLGTLDEVVGISTIRGELNPARGIMSFVKRYRTKTLPAFHCYFLRDRTSPLWHGIYSVNDKAWICRWDKEESNNQYPIWHYEGQLECELFHDDTPKIDWDEMKKSRRVDKRMKDRQTQFFFEDYDESEFAHSFFPDETEHHYMAGWEAWKAGDVDETHDAWEEWVHQQDPSGRLWQSYLKMAEEDPERMIEGVDLCPWLNERVAKHRSSIWYLC